MGICYSEQEEWQAYHKEIRQKRKNRKKKKNASIIYQENSIYQNSFASKVQNSFREDIYESIEHMAFESGSVLTGQSIAVGGEMSQDEIKIIYQSVSKINPEGKLYELSQALTLCNLRTKNFLHTHKVYYPDLPKQHQVSCCPYNSNHIIEYDIWKFIKAQNNNNLSEHLPQLLPGQQEKQQQVTSEWETSNQSHVYDQDSYYIYHPFTQRFLNYKKGHVVCTQQKMVWKIISLGPKRNGGFIKILCQEGELCMSDERGLLTNHRKLGLCPTPHLTHLWELRFGQIM